MSSLKQGIPVLVFLSAGAALAAGPKVTPALLEKGKAIFSANCVTCHGEQGDGNGPAGAYLNPKPRNFAKDKFKAGDKPQQVFNTVTKGLPGTAMVGFPQLPEEDRWAVAQYVLNTFRKKSR